VVVDGREMAELTMDDRVRIEKAPAAFKMINLTDYNEYRTLREKLGWSGAPRPELAPSPPAE
jgi:NAD+ kinase